MAFSESTRFRRSSSVVSRQIASETLVVPIRGGVGDLDSIFSFNPVGSEVWALLEQDRSLGDLTSWVVEQYEVTRDQALTDISAFVSELLQAGLVSEPSPAAPGLERSGGVHASC